MFARFIEMQVHSEKKPELIKKLREEILPILRTYKSFYELIPLEVETEPTKFYALSLWHEKVEMERYAKEQFPRVKALLEPFFTAPLVVKHCTVEETIPKKVIAAVAA